MARLGRSRMLADARKPRISSTIAFAGAAVETRLLIGDSSVVPFGHAERAIVRVQTRFDRRTRTSAQRPVIPLCAESRRHPRSQGDA
jgi:hypothetical protein